MFVTVLRRVIKGVIVGALVQKLLVPGLRAAANILEKKKSHSQD